MPRRQRCLLGRTFEGGENNGHTLFGIRVTASLIYSNTVTVYGVLCYSIGLLAQHHFLRPQYPTSTPRVLPSHSHRGFQIPILPPTALTTDPILRSLPFSPSAPEILPCHIKSRAHLRHCHPGSHRRSPHRFAVQHTPTDVMSTIPLYHKSTTKPFPRISLLSNRIFHYSVFFKKITLTVLTGYVYNIVK